MKKIGETGLTFIVGNMFGGKTSELIHRLNLEQSMGRKVQAFNSPFDKRYGEGIIGSHNGGKFPALSVPNSIELLKYIEKDAEVLGFDEIQFWDDGIIDFVKKNINKYEVIVAGLQLDFRGEPFPMRKIDGKEYDSKRNVSELISISRIVPKYPECTFLYDSKKPCRKEAIYVQRSNPDGTFSKYEDPTIMIGAKNFYAPRCCEHFVRSERK